MRSSAWIWLWRDNLDETSLTLFVAAQSGSHGDLWVKMFDSGCHGKSPVVASYPRSEPVCVTRPVSDAASNSHPSPLHIGRTNIPLASGKGSGARDHSLLRLFKPSQISVRSPGSAGADQAPEDERGEASVFTRPLSRLLPAQPRRSHISRRRSAAFAPRQRSALCGLGHH